MCDSDHKHNPLPVSEAELSVLNQWFQTDWDIQLNREQLLFSKRVLTLSDAILCPDLSFLSKKKSVQSFALIYRLLHRHPLHNYEKLSGVLCFYSKWNPNTGIGLEWSNVQGRFRFSRLLLSSPFLFVWIEKTKNGAEFLLEHWGPPGGVL